MKVIEQPHAPAALSPAAVAPKPVQTVSYSVHYIHQLRCQVFLKRGNAAEKKEERERKRKTVNTRIRNEVKME